MEFHSARNQSLLGLAKLTINVKSITSIDSSANIFKWSWEKADVTDISYLILSHFKY